MNIIFPINAFLLKYLYNYCRLKKRGIIIEYSMKNKDEN